MLFVSRNVNHITCALFCCTASSVPLSPEWAWPAVLYLWVRHFLPFLETSLSVLALSFVLQKNGRLLVLNPPPEGEGNIRLRELGFRL